MKNKHGKRGIRLHKIWAGIFISITLFAVVSVSLLFVFTSKGESSGKIDKAKLKDMAITQAREVIPSTVDAEEIPNGLAEEGEATDYSLKDDKAENIGVISADRMTGEINYLYDASKQGASPNVKVDLEGAKKTAKDFLKGKNNAISDMDIEKGHLNRIGMEGPPDNPCPVYQYEFLFRTKINGIFVDDVVSGKGSCILWLSPEDGHVICYGIHRLKKPIKNKDVPKVAIDRDSAIKKANDKYKEKVNFDEVKKKYKVQSDPSIYADVDENGEVGQLRYLLNGDGSLRPYYKVISVLHVTEYDEERQLFAIDAVTGEAI